MVLGFILYETVDLVYHVGKLTYDGSYYLYKWYYNIENSDVQKDKEIELLRLKIYELEQSLLTNGSSNHHKKTE